MARLTRMRTVLETGSPAFWRIKIVAKLVAMPLLQLIVKVLHRKTAVALLVHGRRPPARQSAGRLTLTAPYSAIGRASAGGFARPIAAPLASRSETDSSRATQSG
jgi:hypothetical protein